MQKKELIESVGKYIDKYYIPANDDIRLDKEMKDIFQKIADFCQKRKIAAFAPYLKTQRHPREPHRSDPLFPRPLPPPAQSRS